jgi:hypothetical protein
LSLTDKRFPYRVFLIRKARAWNGGGVRAWPHLARGHLVAELGVDDGDEQRGRQVHVGLQERDHLRTWKGHAQESARRLPGTISLDIIIITRIMNMIITIISV